MSSEIYADKIIPEAWKLVDKHKKKVEFLYWGEKKFYRQPKRASKPDMGQAGLINLANKRFEARSETFL
ncbi:hypothetical protein FBY51_1317 [Zymomonas mobilis]|uniref:hypothetical protein n=1 Tax=Zymomonas mobilis TaxID=542 RepID=UPI00026D84C0|nr:hypothetical protein [Zymomonas mobilis]AFN56040.1 hypothetical protein ZZ6_0136 [Zymomonas mobilis subsp. mobilis ATCC 29191]TQK78531.1 hypothetical protein FBY53_1212 [Zymomonas mobilis]TQL16264.1 hypothetical protein FBY51_1317 [Zymomonas mobilis]GEB87478.1 hypothetical protein ZMO01_08180 [Zymomonas mobilis subsp. mobilis]